MAPKHERLSKPQNFYKVGVRATTNAQGHQEPIRLERFDHLQIAQVAINRRISCIGADKLPIGLGASNQTIQKAGKGNWCELFANVRLYLIATRLAVLPLFLGLLLKIPMSLGELSRFGHLSHEQVLKIRND